MTKPGLSRAIPATFLAFIVAAFLVFVIRGLQNMEPLYDPRVTLVLAPFLMAAAFVWGMGGFDPRMSEHPHGPADAHADESAAIVPAPEHPAEPAPESIGGILTGQMWRITSLIILLLVALFGFALLPTGLRLDTTNDPAADPVEFARNMQFLTPLGIEINGTNLLEADKLSVFIGFIIFTLVSLLLFAGGLGLLFYYLNRGVVEVRASEPAQGRGALWQVIGRGAGGLRRGLGRAFAGFFQR
ncbi:MAG: hypothetical protein MUE40_09885 [Anaerolineae bacterium]|nr:hypothetical protein [Anaerolineae bacterium]